MNDWIMEIFALMFICMGLFFMALGSVGIIRLPDSYHRLHAVTKCSTLGLMGLLLGAMFHLGTPSVVTKGMLIIVFTFVANPVGSHMLGKAALRARFRQWSGTLDDEHAKAKFSDENQDKDQNEG